MWRVLIPSAAAAVATALVVPPVRTFCLQRRVLLDLPNERSSHSVPRPRAGGIAILAGLSVGMALALLLGERLGSQARALLIGALAVGLLGLWDDLRALPVWPRLLAELLVAAWVVDQTGGILRLPLPAPADIALGPISVVLSVIWLVGVTNFFNFMDGIDGIAGGEAAVVCCGVVIAGWSGDSTVVASLVLGASLGFLPYNWWPSRIFLGDFGSHMLGFLLAGLPLLASATRRSDALLAAAIGLTLFLLDPVETLARRWLRGASIGASHREHRYQELVRPGSPHARVAFALVASGLILSVIGAWTYRRPTLGWLGVASAILAFALERATAERATGRQQSEDRSFP